jgi:hypothetical protein
VIRAFTGPTELTSEQKLWVAQQMLDTTQATVYRSGCAYGVDTVAAYLALAVGADLELYVPFAHHNGTLVMRTAVEATAVIRCPKMSTMPLAYRRRNTMMVHGADHLMAFVWQDKFYRSGEWMTINIARKRGIPFSLKVIPTQEEQS